MKNLIVIITVGVICISCLSKSELGQIKQKKGSGNFVKSIAEIPKSDAEFLIEKAKFENNLWVFTISHGGGCDPNYKFQFYLAPKPTFDCVVDTLHVVFKTNSSCKRLDYTDVNFDLNALNICSQKIVFKGGKKEFEIVK